MIIFCYQIMVNVNIINIDIIAGVIIVIMNNMGIIC